MSIDIIGGTSAGGINGIALSKALACNVDMEPLKDVWLNKAISASFSADIPRSR